MKKIYIAGYGECYRVKAAPAGAKCIDMGEYGYDFEHGHALTCPIFKDEEDGVVRYFAVIRNTQK